MISTMHAWFDDTAWCSDLRKILQMSLGRLVYLHEHAESSFKEISEAWWNMLNINRIRPIRITDLLHYLFQQRFVRSLHKENNTLWVNLFRLSATTILNILFLLKVTEIIIPEMKAFREVVIHQHSIRQKRLEEGHSFTLLHVYYISKERQGRKGELLLSLEPFWR